MMLGCNWPGEKEFLMVKKSARCIRASDVCLENSHFASNGDAQPSYLQQ